MRIWAGLEVYEPRYQGRLQGCTATRVLAVQMLMVSISTSWQVDREKRGCTPRFAAWLKIFTPTRRTKEMINATLQQVKAVLGNPGFAMEDFRPIPGQTMQTILQI